MQSNASLEDRTVLLTGGAGSIGQMLVPHLLDRNAAMIRILDNNEPSLSQLKSKLDTDRCRFFAGDVRDEDRLVRAMDGVDVVIHLAAMKHVDIVEYNPFEGVKTNVLGLQNTIDAAIDSGVRRLLFASSDKAANPDNTMGTTKLLGEKLVTAGNKYSGRPEFRLASVRFGNVINSSESVVSVFRRHIQNGGPVELTDERMTRFILTDVEVADLVVSAVEQCQGGEVFLSRMRAIRIDDLARAMIAVFAPFYGYEPGDIDVEIVGKRPGETLHETLMNPNEADRALEASGTYVVPPEPANGGEYLSYERPPEYEPADDIVLSSSEAQKLEQEEIEALIRETRDRQHGF